MKTGLSVGEQALMERFVLGESSVEAATSLGIRVKTVETRSRTIREFFEGQGFEGRGRAALVAHYQASKVRT